MAVENQFDPIEASVEIAECIKTKVNTFSLKMECAVEGLEHMDKEMMDKKWKQMVKQFRKDPTKTNIRVDKSTWTIQYDEVEISENVVVSKNKEDYLLNGKEVDVNVIKNREKFNRG